MRCKHTEKKVTIQISDRTYRAILGAARRRNMPWKKMVAEHLREVFEAEERRRYYLSLNNKKPINLGDE